MDTASSATGLAARMVEQKAFRFDRVLCTGCLDIGGGVNACGVGIRVRVRPIVYLTAEAPPARRTTTAVPAHTINATVLDATDTQSEDQTRWALS